MHLYEPLQLDKYRVRKANAVALLALVLAGCEQEASKVPDSVASEAPERPAPKTLPTAVPVLARGDLISAAGRAASDYAGGAEPQGPDPLVGRTFSMKIAFGCSGPAPGSTETSDASGLASWSWGREEKTIELKMGPGDWVGSALIAASADAPDWEAVEGFWIPRPWLVADSCPAVRGDPLQTANAGVAPQTLGLAAVFETGGSRIGRRNGRNYTFTIRPDGDTPVQAPAQGYRLVLEGRVASFPNGRAIRCRATGPDQRPVCVVATKLDRVAFEGAEGKMLSEWRPG
jgi:hypothetical protein